MSDFRDIFFSKAFKKVPGIDYNRISYELREGKREPFIIYEVVLKENDTWEYVRDNVYPRLARYLKQKGIDPSLGEGFIVALFFKEYVYLISGIDFVKTFCEMEGLNFSAFHFRVLRWLSE